MSKLFFDHLLELKEIDKKIKDVATTSEERDELWLLVDEIIHHKVIGCILDNLPNTHHHEFLDIFYKSPHDTSQIMEFLRLKSTPNLKILIKKEIRKIEDELLESLQASD
jgi:hypothetical protein